MSKNPPRKALHNLSFDIGCSRDRIFVKRTKIGLEIRGKSLIHAVR